jgi:hypothetical protein
VRPPRRIRLLSSCVVAAVALFAVLGLVAHLLYPGGTWWDAHTRGASFWQNFLCDLEWSVALNGEPNHIGSRFAQAAMLVALFGMAPFWWLVPLLFGGAERAWLRRAIRALGLTAVAGTVAVVLMPSERFGALHGAAVIVAGVPGLSATVLAASALLLYEPRPRIAGALGAAMLAFALVDFALYVRTWLAGGPGPLVLPVAQKCALLLLLAWMVSVAVRVRSRDATETPSVLDASRANPQ